MAKIVFYGLAVVNLAFAVSNGYFAAKGYMFNLVVAPFSFITGCASFAFARSL